MHHSDVEHRRLTLGREALAKCRRHVVPQPVRLADDEGLQLRIVQGRGALLLQVGDCRARWALLRASADGVYQMGEVQARSWPVSGHDVGRGQS